VKRSGVKKLKSVIIDKNDLRYNIEKIKEHANTNLPDDNGNRVKIIAVVKSNGYGLGIVEYTKFLIDNGIDFFAVSTIEEALKLRQAGIKEKILMLSSTSIEEDIKTLVENNIIITIGSKESAEISNKIGQDIGKKVKAHIKIDTGFGRYGFVYSNREELIKTLKPLENIKIEGTYTHFSNAYYDDKYTNLQFERFINCIEILKMNEITTGMLHVCNTSAFIKFPNMHLNAVRIGSAFTGKIAFKNSMGLKKIGYLKSNISEIKELPKGFNIGYSNAYTTKKITKVAIIPCGYMDGVNIQTGRDMFRNIDKIRYIIRDIKDALKKQQIFVKINGQKCPILGRIGTYHVTVDITNKENININDEVIFDANLKYIDTSIKREWM
jgi:alanine racemase